MEPIEITREDAKNMFPPETSEDWEKEWDNCFNWTDKIVGGEIEHWKVMYGFTPNQLKGYFRSLFACQHKQTLDEIQEYLDSLFRETDNSGRRSVIIEINEFVEKKQKDG